MRFFIELGSGKASAVGELSVADCMGGGTWSAALSEYGK